MKEAMAKHSGQSVCHDNLYTWRVARVEERPEHPEGDLYHLERNIWAHIIPATVSERQLDSENAGNRNWNYYRDGRNAGGHGPYTRNEISSG